MNPTVKEIVGKWLVQNDYDGLYHPDGECWCDINDLVFCLKGDCRACMAGYNHPGDGEYAFYIKGEKP